MKTKRILAAVVFASLLLSGIAHGDWSDTFLGNEAGSNCSTCVRDTFIGYRAGCLNISTSDNTYVGFAAGWGKPLSDPITGIQNTFVGSLTGQNITSGAQNTFVGYKAGTLNTNGSHNTFIGNRAGYGYVAATSTSSSNNTFVGDDAGQYINTGTKNTALGHAARFTNNNGNLNIFIGESAGYYNFGHWNTIVGSFAGMHNSTGSANVFLGANAGSAETGSNRLYVDNCNVKDDSGNCTLPLIYGEFDNRIVKINGTLSVPLLTATSAGVQFPDGTTQASGLTGKSSATSSFFGYNAGRTTTGTGDTFIGTAAGYSNTTGYANNFFGNNAGYFNTSGYANSFLGANARYLNTIGNSNSFFGNGSGYSNTEGSYNTFVGTAAGSTNATGNYNSFVGYRAGDGNKGDGNSFFGYQAGYSNSTGHGNVFLGAYAGTNETGSNKLYIDNCYTGAPCTSPLVYGEFDNKKVTLNGNLEVIGPDNGLVRLSNVTADNTTKVSRMVLRHYSNSQLPVYLFGAASTPSDNFVTLGGGSTIGNAATQIDLYTATTATTPVGIARVTIKGNGYVGIGTSAPSHPLQMAGGAYTNGTQWIDVSSRDYKDQIKRLSSEEAFATLRGLAPVKYVYRADITEQRLGFIAEDVPDLVATKDRKGLSPMDIVAVLTKVVQEQQKTMQEQEKTMQEQHNIISTMREELNELKGRVR